MESLPTSFFFNFVLQLYKVSNLCSRNSYHPLHAYSCSKNSECMFFFVFFFAAHSIRYKLTLCMFMATDAVAFSRAYFGAGIGPIHLDEVGCGGNETTLISCPHASHQQFQCRYGHWEDAGVRCQSTLHNIHLY